jgi:hypothetical protein
MEADLNPIKNHIVMIEGGLKVPGVISLVVGIVTGIFKTLG